LKPKNIVNQDFDADICIFNPHAIQDRATYANPHERAEGLDYVIVSEKIAAVNAVATGALGCLW